ncbi:hypothetical protein BDW59DRAFT_150701 [Aspergillus cavernicola]|uniref:Uncharacterized protein n=1 Tax=Aspergillus cavernicola TaxID=176166 RepID=A0ABR4HYJ5_9EURO
MSCLSSLFGCCLPTRSPKPTPETQQAPNSSTNCNPPNHTITTTLQPPQDHDQTGYNQTIPLPAYTPRPMSIQEKTLEAHMRDPPISSETYHTHLSTDEKQRLAWEEATSPQPDYYYTYPTHPRPDEVTSDTSSAISFPSSYGNTSTATRETPPPPYSPRVLSPAPSRPMSISSAYRYPPMGIAQPPPVFQRAEGAGSRGLGSSPRGSIDEQLGGSLAPGGRRYSWESDRRYY